MTLEKLNVKTVAIIGGGPSGITTVYDLTRTLKNGTTIFGETDVSSYQDQIAFEPVVFERNGGVGGVWDRTSRGNNNPDPQLPDLTSKWEDKETIFRKTPIDAELESKLAHSSYENPVVVAKQASQTQDKYQWNGSGAYEELFTNVPNKYMTFSYDDYSEQELADLAKRYKYLQVYQLADDVGKYLDRVVEKNHLSQYIRLNSNVERVRKLDSGKWEVTIRASEYSTNGQVTYKWYSQQFDAVVIGNGKTVPSLPHFKGLEEFAEYNKDNKDLLLTLCKSLRDPGELSDKKKILIVGASVSAVDIAQYAFPRSIDNPTIYISRKSDFRTFHDWITYCTWSKGFVNKPEIEEFLPETQGVKFTDGTVENGFDAIILCTGYHVYYPFFEQQYVDAHPDLFKFYQWTWSIDDPTLALVGNTYSIFFFSRVEAQGAALAGTWSGQTILPSKEEQLHWYETVFPEKLRVYNVLELFINPLMKFALKDRPHPFRAANKQDYVAEIGKSRNLLASVFFKNRDGEITPGQLIGNKP